jgi:hypothetical protein
VVPLAPQIDETPAGTDDIVRLMLWIDEAGVSDESARDLLRLASAQSPRHVPATLGDASLLAVLRALEHDMVWPFRRVSTSAVQRDLLQTMIGAIRRQCGVTEAKSLHEALCTLTALERDLARDQRLEFFAGNADALHAQRAPTLLTSAAFARLSMLFAEHSARDALVVGVSAAVVRDAAVSCLRLRFSFDQSGAWHNVAFVRGAVDDVDGVLLGVLEPFLTTLRHGVRITTAAGDAIEVFGGLHSLVLSAGRDVLPPLVTVCGAPPRVWTRIESGDTLSELLAGFGRVWTGEQIGVVNACLRAMPSTALVGETAALFDAGSGALLPMCALRRWRAAVKLCAVLEHIGELRLAAVLSAYVCFVASLRHSTLRESRALLARCTTALVHFDSTTADSANAKNARLLARATRHGDIVSALYCRAFAGCADAPVAAVDGASRIGFVDDGAIAVPVEMAARSVIDQIRAPWVEGRVRALHLGQFTLRVAGGGMSVLTAGASLTQPTFLRVRTAASERERIVEVVRAWRARISTSFARDGELYDEVVLECAEFDAVEAPRRVFKQLVLQPQRADQTVSVLASSLAHAEQLYVTKHVISDQILWFETATMNI